MILNNFIATSRDPSIRLMNSRRLSLKLMQRSLGGIQKPKAGNLTDVVPGKSIGGDIFRNKEGLLPKADGRVWYEAHINYTSGFRGSDRLLYSSDGSIYKITDHYKTFTQIK